MTDEEALQLIDSVCSQFSGNRNDHIKLQMAVQRIANLVNQTKSAEAKLAEDKKTK